MDARSREVPGARTRRPRCLGVQLAPGAPPQPRLRFFPRRPRRLPFGREKEGGGGDQESFRGAKPPPPPPPPPPGRGPEGRGPEPRGRSSAEFTRRFRPSSSLSLSSRIAASADSESVYSTNAKPRERWVSRSMITATLTTLSGEGRISLNCSEEVRKERLPTKILVETGASCDWMGRTSSPGSPVSSFAEVWASRIDQGSDGLRPLP
jgi:hypothetical protein